MNSIKKLQDFLKGSYEIEISSFTDVFEDSYKDGELGQVNYFDNETVRVPLVTEESLVDELKEVLQSYIEDSLYMDYNEGELKEAIQNADEMIFLNNLVDARNEAPTEEQLEQWKNGEISLYNQSIAITIKINGKIIPVNIIEDMLYPEEIPA